MSKSSRRAVAAVAGAAVVAGLTACAPQPSDDSEVSTMRMGMLSYMIKGNWNPVTTNDLNTYFTPAQAVYETLIRLNGATFEFEPMLAESYDIGDDQRSMTLTLRQDVDFTDGTHFDAETAKASLDFAAEGIHASFFEQFGVEVEITGDYELGFTSTKPMSTTYLFNLAILPIASPAAMKDDPTGLEKQPVGTGPYLLEEQVPEVSVSFVRNPDYRDPDRYPFDEVRFFAFDDSIAKSNALKSGQIDVAQLEPLSAGDAEANGLAVHAGGGLVNILQWMDADGSVEPALLDQRVREAIAFSIDRASIAETIDAGYGTVSSQGWSKGSPFYVEGGDDRYGYDLEYARGLMAEAGYADGFALTIPTFVVFEPYEPILIQSLADIGITVTFDRKSDVSDYSAASGSGDYPLIITNSADLFLDGGLRPNGATGYPQLAPLFDQIDNGTPEEADEARQEIGKTVLDEALIIPFSRVPDVWVSIPEITVEVGIITGWPPLLDSYQLAD